MNEELREINHKYDIRKVFIVNDVIFFNKEEALKFENYDLKGGLKE